MKGTLRNPPTRKAPYRNVKIMRTHKFWLLLWLLLIAGCATTRTIALHYKPVEGPCGPSGSYRNLSVFVEPVKGGDSRSWYRVGEYEWVLERPPKLIVYSALCKELDRMGITVAESRTEAQGRMEVEIRWFGPYGYNPSAAAVILAVSLYQKDSKDPLWRGRLQAGVFPRTSALTLAGKDEEIEETASDALREAVSRLSWESGFVRAVRALSRSPGDHRGCIFPCKPVSLSNQSGHTRGSAKGVKTNNNFDLKDRVFSVKFYSGQ